MYLVKSWVFSNQRILHTFLYANWDVSYNIKEALIVRVLREINCMRDSIVYLHDCAFLESRHVLDWLLKLANCQSMHYHRHGFLSICVCCKMSKKLCT